ncbi:uroporphyrinogen-III synthase [Georgenia sp. H159]|uniref:uroporphyrinogen-III synthase n=1 Tax=Georgenia sp. H159 TaxID=3076115 RepID=UPI002D76DD7D|nr:uroporphyrinogen-III synthase [Georgenia sp. H159]
MRARTDRRAEPLPGGSPAPLADHAAAPLAGRRVLVPRPGADDPLARAVEDAGGVPVSVALTETVVADDAVLDRALELAGAAWVVLTSARTVAVLRARADRSGEHLGNRLTRAVAAGTRVAAVGPATAAALRRAGHGPHLCAPAPESAATLLRSFPPADPSPRRVVLPCSALAAPELAEGLRALGWQVERHDVYTTRTAVLDDTARARLTEPWPDVVLLTAGSAVRALLDLLGPPPATARVAVIGAPTERAARQAGLRVDAVATEASPEGLVAAAVHALRHRTTDPGGDS